MSLILVYGDKAFLYLGDVWDSQSESFIKGKDITHILNCTSELPSQMDGVEYMNVPVQDVPDEDIGKYFISTRDFLDKARRENGTVLVHCYAGVSRSATIVIAYLISLGMSLEDALAYVIKKRLRVQPNTGFFQQLKRYSGSEMTYNDMLELKHKILNKNR